MRTTELEDVLPLAREIAGRIVWATVTTVGPDDRPRSRIMHPVWAWTHRPLVGWIGTRPTPVKQAHLAAHPFATCGYWSPSHDHIFLDCVVRWIDDQDERLALWERLQEPPEPVGYDPAPIWPDGPRSDGFVGLELTPYRITAQTGAALAQGAKPVRWEAQSINR